MLYLHKEGFEVELDRSNAQLPKKIRNAQLDQWNFILVAGEEESGIGQVDIRSRDNQRVGKMRIDELVQFFRSQSPKPSRSHDNLYSNVWRPEDYPVQPAQPVQPVSEVQQPKAEEQKEPAKAE